LKKLFKDFFIYNIKKRRQLKKMFSDLELSNKNKIKDILYDNGLYDDLINIITSYINFKIYNVFWERISTFLYYTQIKEGDVIFNEYLKYPRKVINIIDDFNYEYFELDNFILEDKKIFTASKYRGKSKKYKISKQDCRNYYFILDRDVEYFYYKF